MSTTFFRDHKFFYRGLRPPAPLGCGDANTVILMKHKYGYCGASK